MSPDKLMSAQAMILSQKPFRPHRLLNGAHLQTVIASRLPRKFEWGWQSPQTRMVDLKDGTRVSALCVIREPEAPTLLVLHGLAGSSDSIYMRGLSHKAYRAGWNSVLLNLYDLNLKGRKPTLFHSAASRHVGEIIETMSARLNLGPLLLVGVSMGGNMLLKLLGEWGAAMPVDLRAAAAISPLVDLTESWEMLERPTNAFYRVHFVAGLKRRIRERARYLAPFVDMEAAVRVRTIREFDDVVTAPLAGYRDAMDYYEQGSAAPWMPRIRTPTLILHSRDDPVLPWEPFTRTAITDNPNLLIELTDHGGHVGFIEQEGNDIDRAWAENRVLDFFQLAGDHSR